MRIGNDVIPEDVAGEFRAFVESLDKEYLVSIARDLPEAAGGFSLKSSAPRVRSYLLRHIDAPDALPEQVLAILRDGYPEAVALRNLDSHVLEEMRLPLARFFGGKVFRAACLLDNRADVRQIGAAVDWLGAEEAAATEADREAVRRLLARTVEPFAALFDPLDQAWGDGADGETEVTGAAAQAEQVLDLQAEIDALRVELADRRVRARQIKAVEDKVVVLQARCDESEQRLERERAALAAARAAADAAERALADLSAQHTALEQGLRAEVERRAGRLHAERLQFWIADAQAAAAAATAEGAAVSTDLLQRAGAALARQRQHDRLSGTLASVRERLKALKQARDEIRVAAADALKPLSELKAVEQDLDREIHALETTPGVVRAAAAPGFTAALEARINACANGALAEVGALLDALSVQRLLPAGDLAGLYRQYHRKLSVAYSAAGPKVLSGPAVHDPFWRLQHAFGRQSALILLIDGYNVVYLLDDLFGPYGEDGQPGARARQRLVDLAVALTAPHPRCELTVFFDGPRLAQSSASANVNVQYSGGVGEHRADADILKYLDHCRAAGEQRPRVVVTDDGDVRRQARAAGAEILPVRQFGSVLAEVARGGGAVAAAAEGGGRP